MENVEWPHITDAEERELFPGVQLVPLWKSAAGASAQVLKIEPGCSWVGVDNHDSGPEEVYVVEGAFNDGVQDYPAGSFIHNPKGSSHIPQSAEGVPFSFSIPKVRVSASISSRT